MRARVLGSASVAQASLALSPSAEARARRALGFDTPEAFEAALEASGWRLRRGRGGEIEAVDWAGPGPTTGLNQMLPRLGPYVEAGSFIVLEGVGGARCRWDFDGETCTVVDAGLIEPLEAG